MVSTTAFGGVLLASGLTSATSQPMPSGCGALWRQGLYAGTPPDNMADSPSMEVYDTALQTLDIKALMMDLEQLFTDSQECWPADFGNYGPFLVRLAWHSSGSFRDTDGKGGVGGGRQRFEPERSWDDNTNLDKARALLNPIKAKYGDALSWGDLFAAAGTTAMRSMGTPIKQMCFGRADDVDGVKSLALGPSQEQQEVAPCEVNGLCQKPLGTTTIGLIYLNPEGPVMEKDGKPNPDPALSAIDVRDAFSRMGHNDRATVALIGGGHAFGKTHGACPDGAGLPPNEAYSMTPPQLPWMGNCSSGRGEYAYTSGFEGPWTSNPLQWDNEFFKMLLEKEWEKHMGPGEKWQWRIKDADQSMSGLMRLTSDMALIHDDKYLEIVKEFAANLTAFDEAFDEAWTALTVTNGGGIWSKDARCDHGKLPVDVRSALVMLDSDIIVV